MDDEALDAAADELEKRCSSNMLGYGPCRSHGCELCDAARDFRAKRKSSRREEINRRIKALRKELDEV